VVPHLGARHRDKAEKQEYEDGALARGLKAVGIPGAAKRWAEILKTTKRRAEPSESFTLE